MRAFLSTNALSLTAIVACEKSITSFSTSPFLKRVLPDSTKSHIASAKPILGAISTDPWITSISAFTPFSSRNVFSELGYEVAIFLPFRECKPLYQSFSLGTAIESLHF